MSQSASAKRKSDRTLSSSFGKYSQLLFGSVGNDPSAIMTTVAKKSQFPKF